MAPRQRDFDNQPSLGVAVGRNRQGNQNPEVSITQVVTEGSFDTFMWQTLERKGRFIDQIMTGASIGRETGDVGDSTMSYAEVKAISSGNPLLLTLAEAEQEVQRLTRLEPYRQSAEVSRLALIDDVLANGETWFLRESSGSCSRRASAAWSVSRTRCPYGRRHLHRPRHRTCTREGASTQWLPRPNRRSK